MGADSSAENTTNAPKCIGPICLPKPQKSSLSVRSPWYVVCITNIVCYILLPCQWQMVDICAKGFRMLHGWSSSSMCHSVHSVLYCLFKGKHPKYSKNWPFVDCGCSKMLNHSLNYGLNNGINHGLNHDLFLLLQGFFGKIYSRLNW